jgi:predicted MFS family arabinose efflux permease
VAHHPAPAPGSRWLALAVLTAARTAMGLQFQSVAAVSPLLMEHLHIANTELGLLVGLFSLPGVLLALPGGLLGTRFGDRRVVLGGLALMAIGSALIGVADTLTIAMLGRLLTAVGAVLLNVVMTKMVADWFARREIVWAMTIFINAWPVGIGIALFTLPAVARAWGLAAAFHASALFAVVACIALLAFYRDPPAATRQPSSVGLRLLSRREWGLVSLAAVPWTLYNVSYAVMLAFLPALLVRGGVSVEQAGALVGVQTMLFIVSILAGGALGQWVVRPAVGVAVGLLVLAGALWLLPHGPAAPILVVAGLFGGLPAGPLVAAPAAVLRAESRGPGLGVFYTWYYAGMSLLPPIAGRMQDVYQGAAALTFAAVLLLFTLAGYVAFRVLGTRPVSHVEPARAIP